MRLGVILVILKKELLETLRDRKTLFRLFVLPMLIYPLLVLGVAKFEGSKEEERQARSSRITVWGAMPAGMEAALAHEKVEQVAPFYGAPEPVVKGLGDGTLQPTPQEETPESDSTTRKRMMETIEPDNAVQDAARTAVGTRNVDAVIVVWPGAREAIEGGAKGSISVYYDSVRDDSAEARNRIEKALDDYRATLLTQREAREKLAHGFSSAIEVLPRNVASLGRRMGQIIGGMMPFLLILMSLMGAFYPAIDFTAGEKERGTMQTLLCAPLRPIEIVMGKFIATWILALLMGLANLVSMAATLQRSFPDLFHVAPHIYVLTFVLILPVTFLVSALFIALAAFAKDYKDGQNAVLPAFFPLYMLTFIPVLPGVELTPGTALVPVLNTALLIKQAFLGEVRMDLAFVVIGSSLLYAAATLVVGAKIFEREHILLGGGSPLKTLLAFKRKKGDHPTPASVLVIACVVLVAAFYASIFLAKAGNLAAILGSQAMIVVPALGCAWVLGYSFKPVFGLTMPTARGIGAGVLLGASAGAVVVSVVTRLIPVPEQFAKELGEALLLNGMPLPVLLLVVGVLPATCEELMFRGLLFAGLRGNHPRPTLRQDIPAIIVSSLIFALAHASLYRLAPTLALGLVLGTVRSRTGSILPGMLVHAINNSLAMALLYAKPSWSSTTALPIPITAVALVLFTAGLWLLRSEPEPARQLGSAE